MYIYINYKYKNIFVIFYIIYISHINYIFIFIKYIIKIFKEQMMIKFDNKIKYFKRKVNNYF